MNPNAIEYERAIQNARSGDKKAEHFLRLRIKSIADEMPSALLISLSEQVLEFRHQELSREAELN